MRPYFAIIKDSFRAAIASRVLTVLLIFITLLLAAIAPFHYRESLDWRLSYEGNLTQAQSIAQQIYDRRADPKHPEIIRIWNSLPSGLKTDLSKYCGTTDQGTKISPTTKKKSSGLREQQGKSSANQELFGELNKMIQDPEFYRPDDWTEVRFNSEAQELRDALQTGFQEQYSRRLNRLLMQEALKPHLAESNKTSLNAYYATWHLSVLDFQSTQVQFGQLITTYVSWLLDKSVLAISIAIAILVTANIIPQTFESGSLNLLLSKPIPRWTLFLSKFAGGCIFIALGETYLFLGIWLWLGLALGVWDNAILYSIPLYITVFAIYYSVSAFIGLVFRNTIMSVIVTLLFWGACFSIGFAHWFMGNPIGNTRILHIQKLGDDLIVQDRINGVSKWSATENRWETVTPKEDNQEQLAMGALAWTANLDEFPRPFGPLINPNDNHIVSGKLIPDPSAFSQQPLLLARGASDELRKKGNFPVATVTFLKGTNSLIAITAQGKFYRYSTVKQKTQIAPPEAKSPPSKPSFVRNKNEYFSPIGPDEPITVSGRNTAALNRSNDEIVVYNKNTLHIFSDVDGQYQFDRSIEIETGAPDSMSCCLDYQGNTIVMVLGNGQVITVDAQTLQEKNGYRPETRDAISQVVGSPEGRWFFLIYRNQHVWTLDTQNDTSISKAKFKGQGLISAVNCISNDEVIVADRGTRVRSYSLPDFSVNETYSSTGGFVDRSFWYLVRPLYQIWPKPGEFYKVVSYLSSASDAASNDQVDLALKPKYQDPWQPLTSGLMFMAGMLLISCIYFTRRDY